MGTSLREAIEKQADFIYNLSFDSLSEKSREQAKLILLDSIGCMAAGVQQYQLDSVPKGSFGVVGYGKSDKTTATFINGAALVKNELDEGNQFAFGHPACHFVPALIVELGEKGYTGKEIITAIVAAYETSCRFGCSLKTKEAMHVHGTCQTMGATAVVGKLRNKTSEEIVKAIITAESLPQSTSWMSAFNGDQVRNGYIGMSNLVGAQAYLMNEIGVCSSIETMTHVWEKVLEGSISIQGLTSGLGEDFYIEKNYFKIHNACRYTHCFADMAIELLKQGLDYRAIETIEIDTYYAAAKLSGQSVNNSFAMKFSIPVALATCLVYGNLDMDTVTDEKVLDARVSQLASRIFVREEPEYTFKLPEIRANKMTIRLNDGSFIEKTAQVTKGDYTNPFSKEEIVDKFCNLTGEIWSSQIQEEIVDMILNLENCKDVGNLLLLIA